MCVKLAVGRVHLVLDGVVATARAEARVFTSFCRLHATESGAG